MRRRISHVLYWCALMFMEPEHRARMLEATNLGFDVLDAMEADNG